MQEKHKLNFANLNKLAKPSLRRQFADFFGQAVQGAVSGLGTGALIVSLLALGGITVALMVEIIIIASVAAVFSGIFIGIAVLLHISEKAKIADLDKKLEVEQINLKKA